MHNAPDEDGRDAATVVRDRIDALDAATLAITQELSLERVLQLIVDRVRPLVGTRYAALGVVGRGGLIDRFITSGVPAETRAAIGHPPTGNGLLGVIIEEPAPLIVDDIAADPRSVGFPVGHPPMTTLLCVPVRDEGRVVGNLYLSDRTDGRPFDEDDASLVGVFARHAGLAIHNARVHEELRHLAVLQDRERIAQDLHDGAMQSLYAVALSLEDVAETTPDADPAVLARIDANVDAIHASIGEIRDFISGLRSPGRMRVSLPEGVREIGSEFRDASGIELEVRVDGEPELDDGVALQLLKLTREALSNVARHAEATAVRIDIVSANDTVELSIADDGRGFDPTLLPVPGHLGFVNMQARADDLEGILRIHSEPGSGTRVTVTVPISGRTGPGGDA